MQPGLRPESDAAFRDDLGHETEATQDKNGNGNGAADTDPFSSQASGCPSSPAASSQRMESKQRFSSLKVLKFNGLAGGGKPPPVPPKDAGYPFARQLAAASSTTSLSQLGRSTDNLHAHSTLSQPDSPSPSPSPGYHGHHQQYLHPDPERGRPPERENSTIRKSLLRLTNLSRKPFNRQASGAAMAAVREDEPLPPPPKEDPGISKPWGFKHHVHVTEDYTGIPQSWAESLAAQGVSEAEIQQLQQQRILQQQQLANVQYDPTSPIMSANGRLVRPQQERQGSYSVSDDHASSSYHSSSNGYGPSPSSRPNSPGHRTGTPQPTPIRTAALQVTNDPIPPTAISPPPSYSADSHLHSSRVILDDKTRIATPPHDAGPAPHRTETPTRVGTPVDLQQRSQIRSAAPLRPIPAPPTPASHSNESGSSPGIDVGTLLSAEGDISDDDRASLKQHSEYDDDDDVRSDEQEPRSDVDEQFDDDRSDYDGKDMGEEEEADENEDEDEDEPEPEDKVPALPAFKLPTLPPRLSLHQDGAGSLGDFDFTNSLFSSLAPDTLLTLSSLSSPDTSAPASTRSHPPVIVERPLSMFPESPNPSPLPTPATAAELAFPSPVQRNVASPMSLSSGGGVGNVLSVRTASDATGTGEAALSAVSTGAFSIGDFPMPPPLPAGDSRPNSPLRSPSFVRRAPSPLALGDRSSSGSPRPNGVLQRRTESPALPSEPPSPAPVPVVAAVAKRAVAREIQSPASASGSGRNSPANTASRSASPAFRSASPGIRSASPGMRSASPGMPFSPVKGPLANVLASGSRPSSVKSPVVEKPVPHPLSPLTTVKRNDSTTHRPPRLQLGVDVSSERLAVQVERSPDPRGQPAESPTTAVLSQLLSTHFPPTPENEKVPPTARPNLADDRPSHTRGAGSISHRVPPIIVPPDPQRRVSLDGPSPLDDWLRDEDEAELSRDDEDVLSAESVLDAWLTSNGDSGEHSPSVTTPGESPSAYSHSHPQIARFPPPSGPPPPPPRTALPQTPGSARHDVPSLRVDTAAAPNLSTPPPQQKQFPHISAAQASSLIPAPPGPWLHGSPASETHPVYLPAELEPLRNLIHLNTDAQRLFGELVLVAQGQYGDVFAVSNGGPPCAIKIAPLYIPTPLTPASAATASAVSTPGYNAFDELGNLRAVKVSPKMAMLKHELVYIGRMRHEHVLGMDALYFVEDSLWIKMELMVRSLADLVGLCGESDLGEEFVLQEGEVARFAADTLEALKYLENLGIAHRDVRSDNLLLNGQGVVKLADFSHAVKRLDDEPIVCRDIVGVAYWRAAEINSGPYDAMRVDVWSVGATVWELMESEPPFERTKQLAHRWPPLQRARNASGALHDFLRRCSDPPATRPTAAALLQTPWIKSACHRPRIIELLERARRLEENLALDADEDDR